MAWHETKDCTLGSGKVNNAFGIMTWKSGKRKWKTYDSCQDSYKDFYRIWAKYYGRFPDEQLANKWSGNDRADHWLRNVTIVYNQ